jgi:hypothetical protein
MWRRVPCEQQLNMGQSALRNRRNPFQKARSCINILKVTITAKIIRKGIGLIFPNTDTGIDPSGSNSVTKTNSETSAEALGRVVFSL